MIKVLGLGLFFLVRTAGANASAQVECPKGIVVEIPQGITAGHLKILFGDFAMRPLHAGDKLCIPIAESAYVQKLEGAMAKWREENASMSEDIELQKEIIDNKKLMSGIELLWDKASNWGFPICFFILVYLRVREVKRKRSKYQHVTWA